MFRFRSRNRTLRCAEGADRRVVQKTEAAIRNKRKRGGLRFAIIEGDPHVAKPPRDDTEAAVKELIVEIAALRSR